jgi:hypothetical protein
MHRIPDAYGVLTRAELTAALAARQGLLSRWTCTPAEAIRALTPLQAQHAPAAFLALAARLDGFTRESLEAAIGARTVVKSTLMRLTLHLAAAEDYPAYHQLARQARMRTWRKTFAHLDEEALTAELTAWFSTPRGNAEIRERVGGIDGVEDTPYAPIFFARTLLPLVQLPPAGHFDDRGRDAAFVVDPRPLPSPQDAATLVLRRYLAAFGPASRRDVAGWARVAQRDFAAAFERVGTVSYRDEQGTELLDLPGAPLPPASTPLPPRLLAHWDQTLLAYADRDRIMPPELLGLQHTISGDPTVTVDGRVAASWSYAIEGDAIAIAIDPHADIPRAAVPQIRAEAERVARIVRPGGAVSVTGLPGGARGPR